MNIYSVVVSNSYGDFGDSYNVSYHQTEEGAYIELDRLAQEEGFNKEDRQDSHGDGYFYSRGGRELCVQTIGLKL